jgi:hypothetical protein
LRLCGIFQISRKGAKTQRGTGSYIIRRFLKLKELKFFRQSKNKFQGGKRMAQERREEHEHVGKDIPGGDGTVSDEQVNAIDDKTGEDAATGRDHSTENHELTEPESGVGAFQDREDTSSDVARIED